MRVRVIRARETRYRVEGMNEVNKICPFTTFECNGGVVYENGSIGCAFKETPESECEWIAEMPEGTNPRDFYNTLISKIGVK